MAAYEEVKASLQSLPNFTSIAVSPSIELSAVVCEGDTALVLQVATNSVSPTLALHWGVGIKRRTDWVAPLGVPGYVLPTQTHAFDAKAVQSAFTMTHGCMQLTCTFPIENAPLQINFVVKDGNTWFNNNSKNYAIVIRSPPPVSGVSGVLQEFVDDILTCEGEYNSWTLMHRYNKCREWLERLDVNDIETASWLYVWMRYSATRQLTWQRQFNTRPSELANSQKQMTYSLAEKIGRGTKIGLVSPIAFYRYVLGSVGRGGDNGQRIRDQILEIIHRNHIKETNDHFYEQWHQKLHNNTTPDDVAICEAAIAFNETNDMKVYWATLKARGVDKARLESFERPIRVEPYYFPQIIPDLKDYLKLLKSVHMSDDLMQLVGNARPFVSSGINSELDVLCQNFFDFDALKQMGRISHVRHLLTSVLGTTDSNALREVLYLDIGLEAYVRQLSEKIVHVNMEAKWRIHEMTMVLENFRRFSDDEELNCAFDDWVAFSNLYAETVSTNKDQALVLKAAADRIARTLGRYIDKMSALLQPKAELMAVRCNIPSAASAIFAEEAIRGSLLFSASSTFRKIDRFLRSFAKVSPWQIISPGKITQGTVRAVPNLHDIQLTHFSEATILIVNHVGGEEEIPEGVRGVISKTELDTLAHVSVRARNSGVFLAVCFDEEVLKGLTDKEGTLVQVVSDARGEVHVERIRSLTTHSEVERVATEVKRPKDTQELVIDFDAFEEGRTGAKGNNCKAMKNALPAWIRVPRSCALPFGTCERLLQEPENLPHANEIHRVLAQIQSSPDPKVGLDLLPKLKEPIMALTCPAAIAAELKSGLQLIGVSDSGFSESWKTIKRVWASKYNERAFVSTLKAGISLEDIVMSVLCQEVISGDFAFVLHTKNPVTNNEEEIYGEVVVGLGETLVGAYPGRALSFTAEKHSDRYEIVSFPNKSVALVGSGFIFRSDSNSEDLPGFAGAGLFDSYLIQEPKSRSVRYSRERVSDKRYRDWLVGILKQVGMAVEAAFDGVPQDIEGVVQGEEVVVVQSRPQV